MTTDNRINACRFCGNENIEPCISIGTQYLSSLFPINLSYRGELKRCSLDIVRCVKNDEQQCGSLQLAYEYNLTTMYAEYPYTSSSNSSMRIILEDLAKSGRKKVNLEKGDVILDIGCNDGTLLSYFEDDPVSLVGIDPAQNVESNLSSKNFMRVKDFFSKNAYSRVTESKAKIIFSAAMFYHLSDPVEFCRDVADILSNEGVFIIQMAYLPDMINNTMYDNIVHEHIGYYCASNMKWLLEKAGLEIFDLEFNSVYGGSFRVFVKKMGTTKHSISNEVHKTLAAEDLQGVFGRHFYSEFEGRMNKSKKQLVELVTGLKQKGHVIWGYGASTKGNTILQFCGLNGGQIDAIADTNPFKIGKFMIGSDIPIRSEVQMRESLPDYLLVLPYSFTEDFRRRELDLVSKGVRFICPLPHVVVV